MTRLGARRGRDETTRDLGPPVKDILAAEPPARPPEAPEVQAFESPLTCSWEVTCEHARDWRVLRVLTDASGKRVHVSTSRPMLRDQVTQRIERDTDSVTSALFGGRYAVEGQADELARVAKACLGRAEGLYREAELIDVRATAVLSALKQARKEAETLAPTAAAKPGERLLQLGDTVRPESEVKMHERWKWSPVRDNVQAMQRVPLLEREALALEKTAAATREAAARCEADALVSTKAEQAKRTAAREGGDRALLALRTSRIL